MTKPVRDIAPALVVSYVASRVQEAVDLVAIWADEDIATAGVPLEAARKTFVDDIEGIVGAVAANRETRKGD